MKMKRYFAADSRQALRDLRDEQGPDAVILSNRRVNGGVEIIAAMDYEDSLENTSMGNPGELSKFESDTNSQNRESHSFDRPSATEQTSENNPEALNKIQDELKGLRDIMEAPLMQMAWGEMGRVQPLHASLLKQLMTLGLSTNLSKSLAKRIADKGLHKRSWIESLKLLAKLVPINDDDILNHGGVVSLVGPTGVGKTTTIAKLAARFALKHGRRGVTLITTDNYRIGAHEQLRTYGRILGVPVHVASDADELKAILKEVDDTASGKRLTLIDTAGVCQNDIRLSEQLNMLDVKNIDIKNYLVLSATAQINLQHDVVRAFKKINLSGCVITKTDEAASLGEVISVLIQHHLSISYVCDGQKVPDNIHKGDGKLLVKEAVKLMRQLKQSPSVQELAYTLGGMANNANV